MKQLKAQRRADYLQRIPIEGKFGQAKSGYRLNYIRAKRADTLVAWINSIFLVMNLLILLEVFFVLSNKGTNRVNNEHWATPITIGRVRIVPIAWLEQIQISKTDFVSRL